jgi:hypothetical protein
MVQNLGPLAPGQGPLHECRQEVGIEMLKALQELPILDRQLSVALIADRSSFQPLEHNFGQSMHIHPIMERSAHLFLAAARA